MSDPTIDEITALNRAVEIAQKSGDQATAQHLDTLSDRLRASLPAAKRARLGPDISALMEADGVALRPGPRETIDSGIMATIREAIMAGVWIRADHQARVSGSLSVATELGPVGVLLGEGRQYLVAYSQWAQDIRLFALTGFKKVELTNRPFDRPDNFDLPEWLSQSFGVWREAPQEVTWQFSQHAATDARHYLFHPQQEMIEQPDGTLVVKFRAGGLREMCWHLFRWGDQVQILEPPILKKMMTESLADALDAHNSM